jgi:hypothetical protein
LKYLGSDWKPTEFPPQVHREVQEIIEKLKATHPWFFHGPALPHFLAFRGQSDEAMHWLERAYTQEDALLRNIKGDLALRSLESDPRYKAFLRKMNLPE